MSMENVADKQQIANMQIESMERALLSFKKEGCHCEDEERFFTMAAKTAKSLQMRMLGYGSFGQVFLLADGTVLKTTFCDPAYDHWAKFAIRSKDNIHLPKIFSRKKITLKDTTTGMQPMMYHMERLHKVTPIRRYHITKTHAKKIDKFWNYGISWSDLMCVVGFKNMRLTSDLEAKPKSKFINAVRRKLNSLERQNMFEGDIRSDNVMCRIENGKPTIVLTDPICTG